MTKAIKVSKPAKAEMGGGAAPIKLPLVKPMAKAEMGGGAAPIRI